METMFLALITNYCMKFKQDAYSGVNMLGCALSSKRGKT